MRRPPAMASGTDGRACPSTAKGRDATAGPRMTGKERREQLLDIGRSLFAEKGFDAHLRRGDRRSGPASPSRSSTSTSAARKASTRSSSTARCSALLDRITGALTSRPPARAARAGGASRCSTTSRRRPTASASWCATRRSPSRPAPSRRLISDVASQVEHILASQFKARGFDPKLAPMYAQMLVGMVALTGQWWLDARKPQEGRRRRAPGQPGLERPVRPGGEARAARRRPRDRRSEPADARVGGAASAARAARAGCRAGRRRSTGGSPGSRRPTRPRPLPPSSRAASASRSSTRSPGCALRAGRKSSSTPRCSSTPADRNHAPPRAASTGGLATSGMPEQVAVERAQRVLRPGRRRELHVVQPDHPAHAASAARWATAKIRRYGSTVPHGRSG